MDEVPELRAFLRKNPQVEPDGKAACFDQIAAEADELVRNFIRLVAEKGRAGELGEISAELDDLVAKAQNRLSVELTTAHELSDADATSIVQQIEKASGRSVEATRSVDPSLIGGIVLQVGSHRADGSVRGRLERQTRSKEHEGESYPQSDREADAVRDCARGSAYAEAGSRTKEKQ